MSPKQKKLAGKAPPPNKLDEKDFAVLRAEKAKGRGMGLQDESVKPGKVKPVKAALGLALGILGAAGAKKLMKKKSTMEPGVTSSKMPINLVEEYKEKAMGKRMGGKVQKANLGLMFMKKAKDKGAKGMEFLSPLAMLKRISGRKAGGVMKYKRGSGLDLPVISSVKPAVHKTKRAQNLSKMKIQFNKQRSRMGDFAKKKGLPKPLNTSANFKNFTKTIGVFPKVSGPFSSMAEMRKAKGFKPGESASEFNKRRKALSVAKNVASKTRIGKIALGVGALGIGAKKYLESKMKKKKELEGDIKGSTAPYKVKKKMGGGMMQKPMGYKEGRSISTRGGGVDSSIIGRLRDAGPFKRIPLGKSRMTDEDRKKIRQLMEKRSSRKKALDTAKRVVSTVASAASPVTAAASAAYKLAKKMKDNDRMTDRDLDKAKSMVGTSGSKNRPIIKDHSSRNPNPKKPKMMGGGMMQKPMGYKTGGGHYDEKNQNVVKHIRVKKKMGGGMMQKPMGYSKGTMIKARGCKLGRTRPTKIT